MATIDKLLKYLGTKNVATFLDEEDHKEIATNVVMGYEIDDDSRQKWLQTNLEAMKLIKTQEDINSPDKEFPFHKASKVTIPLITSAVIQLASRLIQHVTRNDKVVDCAVLGQDTMDPQTGRGVLESLADRVSKYMSYECLIESDSWLTDTHKWLHTVASWGIAFKEVYYDHVSKKNRSDLLPPSDVIINKNITSLDQATRITIRQYLTENDIKEKINSGQFLEIDFECLQKTNFDNPTRENDSREIQPIYEILKQYCLIDLDDDGYAEPYCVFVVNKTKQLLGIYPAFEFEDIEISEKGEVICIGMRHGLVDIHCVDDPEGGYYSLGLNHLLLDYNKSLNSIVNQLHDAGTLSNTASMSGFVDRDIKTRERNIKFKIGEFVPVEVPPNSRIQDHFSSLPFREPSQVLLGLFQILVEMSKEAGFMTEVLAGDTQGQNVPATTMLAMVEQQTRAFKPLVQKEHQALKKEFKIRFHLNSKYLDKVKYIKFQKTNLVIQQDDFDETKLDICPVADPTMSSEAHKYARLQALIQLLQTPVGPAINTQAALMTYFTELQFPNPQSLIKPPAPPTPDPKILQAQVQAQIAQKDQEIEQIKIQAQHEISLLKNQIEQAKINSKHQLGLLKANAEQVHANKEVVDAHFQAAQLPLEQQKVDIMKYEAETERERVKVMEQQPRKSQDS